MIENYRRDFDVSLKKGKKKEFRAAGTMSDVDSFLYTPMRVNFQGSIITTDGHLRTDQNSIYSRVR